MEAQPLVSVIIPVYNTEQYVGQTLDCITGQSLRSIEVIAVDDGSTDGSRAVLEAAAQADGRIRILSQSNKGQSEARNLAMRHASGKYLYFMDSDDLLEPDTLERCFSKCEAESLDLLFFDADVFSEEGCTYELGFDYHRAALVEDRVYGGPEVLGLLLERGGYRASPCLSFIRRDYLESIGLSFYPGIIHEDDLFTAVLYIEALRVGRIAEPFFKRRLRGDSVMTSRYSLRNAEGYLTVARQLRRYTQRLGGEKAEVLRRVTGAIAEGMLYKARRLPFAHRMKVLSACRRDLPGVLSLRTCAVLICPAITRLKR